MEIQEYINHKKKIQLFLIEFIDGENDNDQSFDFLIKYIKEMKINQNRVEFKSFLLLIYHIANNYHRNQLFFAKIKRILLSLKDQIIQNFSNHEIYELFKNNKVFFLFFIQNQIIHLDETIAEKIYFRNRNFRYSKFDDYLYYFYFYPEIKPFLKEDIQCNIQKTISELNYEVLENYEEKRINGVNDSYLCKLIREDSVIDFIIYVNQTNLPLSSKITPSFYETNNFLIRNNVTLIEYSAFYGSIQIYQYLRNNNVKIKPFIWFCAIHSKNAELIHLIEEDLFDQKDLKIKYSELFEEAIKCHHNDIAFYIQDNLIIKEKMDNNKIYQYTIKYHNYTFLNYDNECDYNFLSFNLAKYNYYMLVKLLLMSKQFNILKYKSRYVIDRNIRKNNYEIVNLLLDEFKTDDLTYFIYNHPHCPLLTEITIPSSIKIIKNMCFEGFSSLRKITIPSSVKIIESNSFKGCSSLKEITIPSSVESIGNGCFEDCSSLEEIAIPSSIKSIGNSCFEDCSSLEEIEIPSSVKIIESNSFKGCSSLKKIIIPSSIKSIGNSCFDGCLSLKKIDIPLFIHIIEFGTFKGCTSLNEINFPPSIEIIEDDAFESCLSLENIIIPTSVTIIGNNCFKGCSSLTKITIPPFVTSIGNNSFEGCTNLTCVSLPPNIVSIGNNFFKNCSLLQSISLPSNVHNMGSHCFEGCSSLKEITIPANVKKIGEYFCFGCKSLSLISFPQNLKSIGRNAFEGCISLSQISLPYSLKSIGKNIFYGCHLLTKISIPPSIKLSNLGLDSTTKELTSSSRESKIFAHG